MKRSNHVWFDYPLNFWRFNMVRPFPPPLPSDDN